MLNRIPDFFSNQRGASAVEYGLIVGLIAVAAVTVLITMGGNLETLFTTVSDALVPAPAAP